MNKNSLYVEDAKEDENDNKYNILSDNLGKGKFGLVKLGENKNTKEKVAIKYITLQKSNNNRSNHITQIQFITSEIESLKKMNTHPNIIKLLSYTLQLSSNKVILYFEYCQKGDLYSLLKQCDHFSLRISLKYFLQLLSAINSCHKMNIVHRDIKLQNIFVTNTFQLKIGDFGLSSIVNNSKDDENEEEIYSVGTPYYRAPE